MTIYTKLLIVVYFTVGAPATAIVVPVGLAALWASYRKLSMVSFAKVSLLVFFILFILFFALIQLKASSPSEDAIRSVTTGWRYMTPSHENYELAMSFNLAGFKLNHPEGAANIGMLYENGWGVPQSATLAADWYQKAIETGDFRSAQADYQLAVLYENGIGVPHDPSKAREHFAEALRISTSSEFETYHDEEMALLASEGLMRASF